jgi:hypothetical protein
MLRSMSAVIGRIAPAQAKLFNLIAHWNADEGKLSFEDFGGYQSRNTATQSLLTQAAELVRAELSKSFSIGILTNDYPGRVDSHTRCFAYCRSPEQRNVIAIPDFLFHGWPECGIEDYESTVEQVLEHSRKPPEDDRLLWIGNAVTHPSRQRFLELAAEDSRIHARGMDWQPPEKSNKATAAWKPRGGFISMPEHCRHRMLIDLQGRGFSARLKLLLFSGRPLLVQNRRWHQYYFEDLKPFVHYIPVEEDLSDLFVQIDWVTTHPVRAALIAAEAQRFAQANLRRCHAIKYLAAKLIELSNR